MKLLNFFRKKPATTEGSSRFADFFINASPEKKKQIFTDAAKLANQDQKRVYEQSLNYKN